MCDSIDFSNPPDMISPDLARHIECLEDLHKIPASETDTPEQSLVLMAGKLIYITKTLSVCMTTGDLATIGSCERLLEDIRAHERLATSGLIRQASVTRRKVFKTVVYLPSRMERLSILIGNILDCCRVKIDEALDFSDNAQSELSEIFGTVLDILNKLGDGLFARNKFILDQIGLKSRELKELVEAARSANWERMQTRKCPPQEASLYVEILDCFRNVNESVCKICESLLTLADTESQSVMRREKAYLES